MKPGTDSLWGEKINKTDKLLARLIKKGKRENTQINKITNEKRETITNAPMPEKYKQL